MNLGYVLRAWRRSHPKRTLEEVAELIDVPVSTLHQVESGRPMSTATFRKILLWLLAEPQK